MQNFLEQFSRGYHPSSLRPNQQRSFTQQQPCAVRPQTSCSMRPQASVSMRPEAASSMRPQASCSMRPEAESSMRSQASSSMRPEASSSMRSHALSSMRSHASSSTRPQQPCSSWTPMIATLKANPRQRPVNIPKRYHPFDMSRMAKGKNKQFHRDCVFFQHERRNVLSSMEKAYFIRKKKYVFSVRFDTDMSPTEVKQKLIEKSNFKNVADVKVLLPIGKLLEKPYIDNDQDMDGNSLMKLFVHKPIYCQCISTKSKSAKDQQVPPENHNSDSDDFDDCSLLYDDQADFSISEDEQSDDSNKYHQPSSFTWTDEWGEEHLLEDVDPSTAGNEPSEIMAPELAEMDPLTVLKAQRSELFMVTCKRNDYLLADLEKRKFSIKSILRVQFIGEAGGGPGPAKKYLRIVNNILKNDPSLFEGDDLDKHLVFNASNVRNQKYFFVGRVIQLSILNDFDPSFFSKELFELMTAEESTFDFSLNAIKNLHEVHKMKDFLNCTDLNRCNEFLRENDIFSRAGTLIQISPAEHLEEKKKIVVQDVIEWYCVHRIHKPLQQLKAGLNEETGFLEIIKKNRESYRKLFCAADVKPTAQSIYDMFSTSTTDPLEKRALAQWRRFLCKVEAGEMKINLQDVLIHLTSSSSMAVQQPSVVFTNSADFVVSTCYNELSLPTGIQKDEDFFVSLEVIIDKKDTEQRFTLP